MAKRGVAAAEKKAEELGIKITTCVVDEKGLIVIMARMDDALPISPRFAESKAYTACVLRMPTKSLLDYAAPDEPYYGVTSLFAGEFTTIPGGLPVQIEERFVGGVGVGGGAPDQDEQCAKAALQAITI